jgi:hypothetical protein
MFNPEKTVFHQNISECPDDFLVSQNFISFAGIKKIDRPEGSPSLNISREITKLPVPEIVQVSVK